MINDQQAAHLTQLIKCHLWTMFHCQWEHLNNTYTQLIDTVAFNKVHTISIIDTVVFNWVHAIYYTQLIDTVVFNQVHTIYYI